MTRVPPWLRSAAVLLWLPLLVVVIVFVVSAGSTSFYFPPLATVLGALWNGVVAGPLVPDLLYSLGNLIAGLLIAFVIGVVLGLIIGERPLLREAVGPLLDFARAVPTIAFVPVIIITLGIDAAPKIVLIVIGATWPILLNTIAGVAGINPAVLETARSYRIPARHRFLFVVLPGAAPLIFAGVRIALAIAVVLTVVSEIYGSAIGLGNFILLSGSSFQVADTYAGTILIGIVGYVLSVVMVALEWLILGWHVERAPRNRRSTAARTRAVAAAGAGGGAA